MRSRGIDVVVRNGGISCHARFVESRWISRDNLRLQGIDSRLLVAHFNRRFAKAIKTCLRIFLGDMPCRVFLWDDLCLICLICLRHFLLLLFLIC